MIHWNIIQLMTCIDRCEERIYTEIFIEINNVHNDAENLVNFGTNGWRIYGMVIVLMPTKFCTKVLYKRDPNYLFTGFSNR